MVDAHCAWGQRNWFLDPGTSSNPPLPGTRIPASLASFCTLNSPTESPVWVCKEADSEHRDVIFLLKVTQHWEIHILLVLTLMFIYEFVCTQLCSRYVNNFLWVFCSPSFLGQITLNIQNQGEIFKRSRVFDLMKIVLSTGISRHVAWYKFSDFPEEIASPIFREVGSSRFLRSMWAYTASTIIVFRDSYLAFWYTSHFLRFG
jgi:hypothetical protein